MIIGKEQRVAHLLGLLQVVFHGRRFALKELAGNVFHHVIGPTSPGGQLLLQQRGHGILHGYGRAIVGQLGLYPDVGHKNLHDDCVCHEGESNCLDYLGIEQIDLFAQIHDTDTWRDGLHEGGIEWLVIFHNFCLPVVNTYCCIAFGLAAL